jgi:hypothetical protein
MDLKNKTVLHKFYGEGNISELEDNIIYVKFGSNVKKFVFPDVFKNHLSLTDNKSKKYIESILKDKDKKDCLRKEVLALKVEKRKRLEKLPLHNEAQVAFGFVDNDINDVEKDLIVFSGNYRTGDNKGNPRTPSRINPNSACLLTYCETDSEQDRYIWGVFMVQDDFIGSECRDGMIPAHEKYRIILDKKDRKKLKYWSYFDKEVAEKNTKWGSVEIKYFSNYIMYDILKDFSQIYRNTKNEKLCEEFINYYCKLNKIQGR